MKIKRSSLIIIVLLLHLIVGCTSTGPRNIYHWGSSGDKYDIENVAIIPSRLPMNLINHDYRMKENWKIAADYLVKNGFKVAEFQSSYDAWYWSGIPFEDSPNSEEEYQEIADSLKADALIIMHYGTNTSGISFGSAIGSTNYHCNVSYQVFLVESGEFITRVDASGKSSYASGLLPFMGIATSFLVPTGIAVVPVAAGFGIDFIVAAVTSKSRWKSAFKTTIEESLDFFVKTFGKDKPDFFVEPPPFEQFDVEKRIR